MHELGEPASVLRLEEAPDPQAGAGEVVVRVRATAANFPDVLLCRGQYQDSPPLPFTPGVEVCGDVVACGTGVDTVAVGDRVVGTVVLPHGGFAELAVMDAGFALPAPSSLDDAQGAALTIAYQTGWFALHRRAQLQPGETLLVQAAAGGVGTAAVQLGAAAGARVIAVVGRTDSADKAAVARAMGADVVLDRTTDDVVARVRELTDGRGVDVVFDPVGGAAYAQAAKVVAFEGRIVVVGFAGGEIPAPALNHALVKNYSIVGLHWGLYRFRNPAAVRDCHVELCRLADEGVITPLVSERVPLEGVPDALQRLADGRTVGRVVATVHGA